MLDRLPLELLQQIVDHVDDDSDLGNFYAAGDMAMKSVIAPILFRTLDISLWMMDIELFGGSARDTRVAVTNYGGFGAPYVESLLITAESSTGVDEEFQRYVNEVLPLLVNLKKFSFMHYGSHEGAPFFSHVADRLSKQPYLFSLTHFIWEDVISDPDAFAAFLAAQRNLVYLGVITDSPQLKIPHDALKNLHYLKGDRDLAFNIFPDRNVEHAWIDLLCSPEVPITPALDQAFRNIKSLSCPAYYPENVFEVVRHFSELEYLRISDSSVIRIQKCFGALKSTKLKYLQVFSHNPIDQEESLVPSLFEAVGSLTVVDMRLDPVKDLYMRYRRDSTFPTEAYIPRTKWKPWWFECHFDDQLSFAG